MGNVIVRSLGSEGFEAGGGRVLKAEDMAFWMDKPQRVSPRGVSFKLGRDVAEVEAGFFSLLPTIRELYILNPECCVTMTDETITQFMANRVLMRGDFDGAAERLARRHGLCFLHTEVKLACAGDYHTREGVDTVSLCFHQDGRAFLRKSSFCEGSSGGWAGGGDIDVDLPDDFYLGMDAESIAAHCGGRCRGEVANSGLLRGLLEKAKTRGGFLINYSKLC